MDLFIDKKITKNLPPVSKINYGKYGICYKYNDMVLKIFTKKLEMYIKKNIKRNLKRESDIIMYPKDRVYIDNKKSFMDGYTCYLASGMDFDTLFSEVLDNNMDLSFDKLLSAFYDEFLEKLNKEKILLEDVKPNHVFIDDSITLIDSDFYRSVPIFKSDNERKKENLIEVNGSIIPIINYFLPGKLMFNIDNMDNEMFLYNSISNIEKLTNNYVDSLYKLSNYKFSDDQIKELKKVL